MARDSLYSNGGFLGRTVFFDDPAFYQENATAPRGEQQYAKSDSWTAPVGVTSVSVVAVGGGGGGTSSNGSGGAGGGGGGLGWKNNIPVVPGTTYAVVVGAAGRRATSTDATTATSGGQSYFIDASTVAGNGGSRAASNNSGGAGGTYIGDGGGNGGGGGASGTTSAGGGGGAGGYTGSGGNAGGYTGSGGGGGGGGAGGSSDAAGAGGGVGLQGEGLSGAGGTYNGANGGGGGGGSGGAPGASPTSTSNPSNGGAYGGGGGGAELFNEHGSGAGGAVRIIWGEGRAFPATNTADGQGSIINRNRKNSGIWNLQTVFDIWTYDRYFASTSLLLQGTGASGSNVFTDSSPNNLLISGAGNVVFSSSVKKYGQSSIFFDGSGDFLSIPYSPAIDLLTGSFTVEAWIYPTTVKSIGMRIFSTGGGSAAWNSTNGIHVLFQLFGANPILDLQLSSGTSSPVRVITNATVPLNTWTHVAATYDGSTGFNLFVNGFKQSFTAGSVNRPSSNPIAQIGTIPGEGGLSTVAFSGYIDDLRVTKNVVRYEETFDPPAIQLPAK